MVRSDKSDFPIFARETNSTKQAEAVVTDSTGPREQRREAVRGRTEGRLPPEPALGFSVGLLQRVGHCPL